MVFFLVIRLEILLFLDYIVDVFNGGLLEKQLY